VRHLVQLPDLHALRHHHLDPALAELGVLAAELSHGLGETRARALGLDLDEFAVGLALFLEVAVLRHLAVLEDQHLVATFLDVAKQMRGEDDAHVARVLDLLDQADHAPPVRRVEAVRRFVQEQQLGPVHDRLGQLGHLFHAQGVGLDLAVARLAETHVVERFVGPFQGELRW